VDVQRGSVLEAGVWKQPAGKLRRSSDDGPPAAATTAVHSICVTINPDASGSSALLLVIGQCTLAHRVPLVQLACNSSSRVVGAM
jgi:hypothetical protein